MADEVVIRAPGRDKPGYLRRLRKAMELRERATGRMTLADMDEMVDFVLAEAEVTAPAGADVREALFDLSKAEWDALLQATTGGASTGSPSTGSGTEGAEVSGAAVDPPSDG